MGDGSQFGEGPPPVSAEGENADGIQGLPPSDEVVTFDIHVAESSDGRQPWQTSAEGPAEASPVMRKTASCPGPGAYMWNDHVNKRRRPLWTMQSPDRKCLDLVLGSWTPATSSVQPRAPDPGEYMTEGLGRNGKFVAQRIIWKVPTDVPKKPEPLGVPVNLPGAVYGRHPAKRMTPIWTMHGAERQHLPGNFPTWTPTPQTEARPGPGAYKVDRAPNWKASSRRGTFGGRPPKLHPDEQQWVPKTRGAMIVGGEAARLRPPMDSPKEKPVFVPSMLRRHS